MTAPLTMQQLGEAIAALWQEAVENGQLSEQGKLRLAQSTQAAAQ